MKAAVRDHYGSPSEVIEIRDIPVPQPGDDDVLVRVRAAGVNPADLALTRAQPMMIRGIAGLRRPKEQGCGQDLAGVVEKVGSTVTTFHAGDEVFGEVGIGHGIGSYAEYVRVPASMLAPKPARLSFEQAGALPMVGLTALHGMRAARVGPGMSVLVNGASGGVGHSAVQIAKALGATVTGVCSTRNVEMVRSIGAERVIDYTREDFTRGTERYDVILDNVANHSLRSLRRVLAPRGVLLLNSINGGRVLGPLPRMGRGYVLSAFSRQTIRAFSYTPATKDLVALKDLADGGELVPVIDGAYPLAETGAALARVATGHVAGKVVVVP
jgi:NADPH:quinone reductase-like Zn-dependent oxidoreductase